MRPVGRSVFLRPHMLHAFSYLMKESQISQHKIMLIRILLFLLSVCCSSAAYAGLMGKITGTVIDKNTQDRLAGATLVFIGDTRYDVVSDAEGRFTVDVPVGTYRLNGSYIGYAPYALFEIVVTSGNPQVLRVEMEELSTKLAEVVVGVQPTVRAAGMVTPLSTQKLGQEEIKVNPGGNFDISKVIQVLPGVAGGTTANRNDIIVRGGGPGENVYYLDGIEIPILNHFQTQGASGGALGILNVSFVQDVQLSSSAFDSRYDNALASTIVINQRTGNPNRLSGNFRLSGSEAALMLEGPLGKKTTYMASVRRSYLQYLFKLLDLSIRPDFYDFQVKVNHVFDRRNELNLIGLGTIDNFEIATAKDADANTLYTARANPIIKQKSYVMGASYRRTVDKGYWTLALSRNALSNNLQRYEDNARRSGNKLFSLLSHESENKLRLDVNRYVDGWKYGYGVSAQWAAYDVDVMNLRLNEVVDAQLPSYTEMRMGGDIGFLKLGAYAQAAKYFWGERLLLSGGVRTDINSYTRHGMNPLQTLSPRLSAKYRLSSHWDVSASVGSYYKLPPYTMLGYQDADGVYANRSLTYTHAMHYTGGVQYMPGDSFRATFEAFYKVYNHYPVSLSTGISFANIGTDYMPVGGEAYLASGKGRVYGVEAYVQQKLVGRLFYVAGATLFRSSFSGQTGQYVSSTWDYGFICSATMGYKFNRNWDFGAKYRIAGGQPYTPFDMEASQARYLQLGKGVYDYSQLNAKRLSTFHQLDVRIDKKYNFRSTSLALYLDFQNILMYKAPYLPKYTFQRTDDNSAFRTTDGGPLKADGSNAIPTILDARSSTIVPAIGFIFEF